MKKLLSILMAIALVLSLITVAGCGKKTNTGSGSGADTSADEEEFFMDMPSELKGTTVKFATWIDHTQTDTADCIIGFEQTTGMKLELVTCPQGDYINKLAGLIASDQAPDVVVENGDFPRTLKVLMPLTVEKTGMDVTDPFWNQELVKVFTVGKYCYLVDGARSCWNMGGACTYYNKTIMEENGLTTPGDLVEDNNWNLDSFYKLMGQINSACNFGRPGTVIDSSAFSAVMGTKENIWDTETDTFKNGVNTPQMLEALQWLVKAKDEGLCELMLSGGHASLENGTSAIQICGCYGLRNKPGWFYSMDIDDLGFTYLPKVHADDEEYPFTVSTRAYGICAGSKNPKGAAYFLRYFLNEDHYDLDKVFKNEEAKKIYVDSRAHADYSLVGFADGVRVLYNPDLKNGAVDGLMGDAVWTSLSQLSVKLSSVSNQVDAATAKANELIKEVIAAQE